MDNESNTFTKMEENSFKLMSGDMFLFYKNNDLNSDNDREALTNFLSIYGFDKQRSKKFIDRFLANMGGNTNA